MMTENFSEEKSENKTYAMIIMILNFLAIIFFLIYSIHIRRMLIKWVISLDKGYVTASDFAILAKHLPDDITEDDLKKIIEDEF